MVLLLFGSQCGSPSGAAAAITVAPADGTATNGAAANGSATNGSATNGPAANGSATHGAAAYDAATNDTHAPRYESHQVNELPPF